MRTPSSLSRRSFLKTSACLASAPWLIPCWSAENTPSNRVVLGFIGVGTQGHYLLNVFLGRRDTQVVAVCDVDTNRREDARKRVDTYYAQQTDRPKSPDCVAFADFRELVARPDIDAVVIATPDHWHALTAIAAAKAGKDIYCEKPLSKSIRESRAMVRAVRENRRVLQVGSMQRSMREFRVACELAQNGVLGKIEHVDVTVGGPAVPCDLPDEPVETGLNWDMWLGPAPKRPYNSVLSPRGVHTHFPNWRHYREYGGGSVTDFGAHHFDIAQWGLGMDASGPEDITPPSDWQTAQFGVRMRYRNGIELVHAKVPGHNDITFFGREGELQVDRGRISVKLNGKDFAKGELSLKAQLDLIEKELLQDTKVQLYRSVDHAGDWIGAIRSRKPPICDVEIGARTLAVCHLANLGYYHGQKMKWNPADESFVEGLGESEWLDVPHRAPWIVG